MRELPDCTPPPVPIPPAVLASSPPVPPGPPPEDEPPPFPAIPPEIEPERWEDFVAFRETFLLHFTEPHDNEALRGVGHLLYTLVLEYDHFPNPPEGFIRSNLRAAVADLRHLEGYLATAGENPPEHEPYEAALCRTAVRAAREVGKAADALEKTLGTWRGEEVS
ncbi:MAG TPA: hypothetical protein VGS07_16995 [Thermoanaerobaculia bacterium]|nr:hypothetical protein [Thermoanaerobaculia bacterium]